MRQNDIEKIIAYQKCFIGPLVWKCFTNNFELLLSEKEFPTFCTFFMYINVHGHQIFAKCTLNECTKMELDPPLYRGAVVGVRGAAVGARGAVVGVRGAAVGNIGMHTYIRHICAPVHVYTAAVYIGLVAAGYSI